MKHFILIMIFCMAFMTLSGQTSVAIGTATTYNSSTNNPTPYSTMYNSGKMQVLVKASELTDAGATAGLLTKLAFNVHSLNNSLALPNFTIKIKNYSLLYLASPTFDLTGFTTVYTSSSYQPVTGWNTHTFSTPFYWDGTSNLLVETIYSPIGSTTLQNVSTYYTFIGEYYMTRYGGGNSIDAPTYTNGTLSAYRPNLKFTFDAPQTIAEQPYTAAVGPGSLNQRILRFNLHTLYSPILSYALQFDLNTNGTTNTRDILCAMIYCTGSNPNLNLNNYYGGCIYPNGNFSISGDQLLNEGDNYFWLVYDVSLLATIGDYLDAEAVQVICQTGTYPFTNPAPAGNRLIKSPLSGIYTIDSNSTATNNYTNPVSAVEDLANRGAIGDITFNIPSDQTFNLNTGVYPDNYALKISERINYFHQIIFQKTGSGANPILSITGTNASNDTGILLYNTERINIVGIDIVDAGTSSNNYLDYGIVLTNNQYGYSKNHLIQNCLISLHRTNANSKAIYLNSGTSGLATNGYNSFYDNNISNSCIGYEFAGNSSTPDINNIIGTFSGSSTITGISHCGIKFSNQSNLSLQNTLIQNFYMDLNLPVYGIYAPDNTSSTVSIYGNQISNFQGLTYNQPVSALHLLSGQTCQIMENTVNNINNQNNASVGMFFRDVNNLILHRNKVHKIYNTGFGYATATGIKLDNITNSQIFNNYIYDISSAFSGGIVSQGLSITGGGSQKIYNNTVYLSYIPYEAVSNQSTALYTSDTSTNLDIRNNIFVNNSNLSSSQNSGIKAVAHYRGTTDLSNIDPLTNYNLYYAGFTSPGTGFRHLIFYDGTNQDSLLTQYKDRFVNRELLSVTEMPPFENPDHPFDLKLKLNVLTQVADHGRGINEIITDFYGNPRSENYPDLGAEEGSFLQRDLSGLAIVFTPITTSTSTISGFLGDVSIFGRHEPDYSTGTSPRIYYKKSADPNIIPSQNNSSQSGWKYLEALSQVPTCGFLLDYSLLSSPVVPGDIIQYFILAKDMNTTPLVTTNPATGAIAQYSVSNGIQVLSLPLHPYQYTVSYSISGTKLVGGTNPDYTNLQQAFADLNAKTLTGNITLLIQSDLAETGQLTLNKPVCEGGTFGVTIKPAPGQTVTVTGNNATSLLNLNDADNTILDGCSNSSGLTRNLSFINLSTDGSVIRIYNGSQNIQVKNTVLRGNSNTKTTYGVYISGIGCNSIYLGNNLFQKVNYGISTNGGSETNPQQDLMIVDNILGDDTDLLSLGSSGISLINCYNAVLQNNEIKNLKQSLCPTGISLGYNVTGSSVTSNRIHNLKYDWPSGSGGRGIYINTGKLNSNLQIDNNLVYDIGGAGSSDINNLTPVGIVLDGSTDGVNLYYNSINLSGNLTNSSTTKTAGILFNSSVSNIILKNNAVVNSLNNINNPSAKNYALYATTSTAFSSIDFNDYYAAGTQGWAAFINNNSIKSGIDSLRVITSQDQNSLIADPLFVSDTDLKLAHYSPLYHAGTPITNISYDFEYNTRNSTTPSIGAFENREPQLVNFTITFTPLNDIGNLHERTLSNVMITESYAGINTTTFAPRLYYKKTTENNIFAANLSTVNGWKWVNSNTSDNPFQFSIDYTLLNSPITYDETIEYFVVAQNNYPEPAVFASPGTDFSALSVSDVTTAPSNPAQFTILPLINTFPYTQTFEDWNNMNWTVSGTRSWTQQTLEAGHCAVASFWDWEEGNYSDLTSPLISLLYEGNYFLGFKWSHLYMPDWPNDTLKVQLSHDGIIWHDIKTISNAQLNSNYAEPEVPGDFTWSGVSLIPYIGTQFYLRFHAISGYGPNLFLDDIFIGELELAAPVVTISKTPDNQYQLEWQPVESAQSYLIYISYDPALPFADWGLFAYTSETNYLINSLPAKQFFRVTASSDPFPTRQSIRNQTENTKKILRK